MSALTCVAFFTTCGGAFGIEPLVSAAGPGWALIMIVATPLVWSIPIALMVAELSTRMPEEGGYYIWVRNTLGHFWAVQEAWWSMSYSLVLLAMFPVLFVGYLTFFIPALSPAVDAPHPVLGATLRWLIAVLVTVTAMLVNLRGVRDASAVRRSFLAVFVLSAFAILVAAWLIGGPHKNVVKLISHDLRSNQTGALLVALSTLFFNYSGWDNISTYAAEVDQPQRNYPRAIAFAILIVLLAYLLPVLTGVSVTTDPGVWNTNAGWPVIASVDRRAMAGCAHCHSGSRFHVGVVQRAIALCFPAALCHGTGRLATKSIRKRIAQKRSPKRSYHFILRSDCAFVFSHFCRPGSYPVPPLRRRTHT
jgi:amino acid transporter